MQNASFMNELIHVRNENIFKLNFVAFDRLAVAVRRNVSMNLKHLD